MFMYHLVCFFCAVMLTMFAMADSKQHHGQHKAQTCASLKRAPSPHCGRVPTPAVDAQGKLWVVFEDSGMIYLAQGQVGGDFTAAVAVTSQPEAIYNDGENRPKLAFGPQGEIYISWVHKTPRPYTGDVRFSRSLDGGRSFSQPITINDDGLVTSHRFESLIVSASGQIHLVWIDKRDKVAARKKGQSYAGAALYHSVSNDRGQSFSPNKKLVDQACECCRIAMDLDAKGEPVIFWRHIFANGFRDHAMQSLSSLSNSTVSNISDDGWRINACPHHGPAMSVDDRGRPHGFWFTGAAKRGGLYYGRFNKISKQMENIVQVSASASASRPQILALKQQIFLLWKELDGDVTQLRLQVSNDYGKTWLDRGSIFSVSGRTGYPQLISKKDKIIATWWTEAQGLQVISLEDNLAITSSFISKSRKEEQNELRIQSFGLQNLDTITRRYSGRPFLLSLWSLDCPPCYDELDKFSEWLDRGVLKNLVLINTDDVSRQGEVLQVLHNANLHKVDNWMFANIAPEQLRMRIDPSWFGELPRSYRYSAGGTREGRSGLFNLQWVLQTESR